MKNIFTLIVLISFISACAYSQKVTLMDKGELGADINNISIIDNRAEESKTTYFGEFPTCSRWYGDDFIAPTKLSYLKNRIASDSESNQTFEIKINTYETVEYCDDSAKQAAAIATAAAVASVSSGPVTYRIPGLAAGDFFRLKLTGTVNGKAFDYTGEFVYSDLKFLNFPSENKEYTTRIKKLFDEGISYILRVATSG